MFMLCFSFSTAVVVNAQPFPQGKLLDPVKFDCDFSGSVIFEIDNSVHPLPFSFLDSDPSMPDPVEGLNLANYQIFNIDPNTGEIEVDGEVVNYMGYGRFVFIGEDANGMTFEFSLYIAECCGDMPPSVSRTFVDQTMSFWEPSGTISGEQILILGNVDVDISINLSDNVFEMGTDASFELIRDASFESFDNVFRPFCNFRWDRIHAPSNDNKIVMDDNSFWNGAIRGVHGENNADIQVLDSKADNNICSVLLENYSNGGPYGDGNGSYFMLSGSLIELQIPLSSTPPHPSSPINTSTLINIIVGAGVEGVGVRVISSSYVEIGQASYDYNTFDFGKAGEYLYLGITDSWVVVENNDFFDVQYSFQALESAIRVGGVNVAQGNYFDGTTLIFKEGSTNIQNCYFDGPIGVNSRK